MVQVLQVHRQAHLYGLLWGLKYRNVTYLGVFEAPERDWRAGVVGNLRTSGFDPVPGASSPKTALQSRPACIEPGVPAGSGTQMGVSINQDRLLRFLLMRILLHAIYARGPDSFNPHICCDSRTPEALLHESWVGFS